MKALRIGRGLLLALLAITAIMQACAAPEPQRDPEESVYWPEGSGRPERAFDLVVATYNVHGLPWPILHNRPLAMKLIVQQLLDIPPPNSPDVIAFQEAWARWYRSALADGLKAGGYNYSHFFSGHRFGTGMLVVSRYPIVETNLHSYAADAPWCRSGMDWWGAKGVGLARIEIEPGSVVDIYNAHLIADYGGEESNLEIREAQDLELADFLATSPAHLPCIVLGDFNDAVGERPVDSLLEHGGLSVLGDGAGLDHVLWRSTSLFQCECLEYIRLDKYVERDGVTVGLSDHACRVARLRITPSPHEPALSAPR